MGVADPGLILVSGPSRGGKSRWAEHLVEEQAQVTYVATAAARAEDPAWQARLRLHRERRPAAWELVECGADLPAAVTSIAGGRTLLIDSLGGFVAWHVEQPEQRWQQQCEALIAGLHQRRQSVVIVIEETGWGVVPPTAVGGSFRDRLGLLAQTLEERASRSWLVVQGRALDLHQLGVRVP